jgi:hypothetical protein
MFKTEQTQHLLTITIFSHQTKLNGSHVCSCKKENGSHLAAFQAALQHVA